MDNLRLTAWDISRLQNVMGPEDTVERLYINFCNPWPRRKHHKKRLTHPTQLERYKTILTPDAQIHFKTDDDDLFNASLTYFNDAGFKTPPSPTLTTPVLRPTPSSPTSPRKTTQTTFQRSTRPCFAPRAFPLNSSSYHAKKAVPPPLGVPLFLYYLSGAMASITLIQRVTFASEGMRQSPRGLSATVPTLGPSGRQDRLNCWVKNRQ